MLLCDVSGLSVHPVVCPWQDPTPTPQKNFPTFTFLRISGCFMPSWVLKKMSPQFFFHLKLFWVKQCYQAFLFSSLVFLFWSGRYVSSWFKLFHIQCSCFFPVPLYSGAGLARSKLANLHIKSQLLENFFSDILTKKIYTVTQWKSASPRESLRVLIGRHSKATSSEQGCKPALVKRLLYRSDVWIQLPTKLASLASTLRCSILMGCYWVPNTHTSKRTDHA